MPDDDQGDPLFDWRLIRDAAGQRQRPGGGRQERADRGKRRRPPVVITPKPPPSAQMIPFPLRRRQVFIERLAAQVAARPGDVGELHLRQQLERQRDVLARKGIPEKAIARELRSLAAAVRAELWRLVLGEAGA